MPPPGSARNREVADFLFGASRGSANDSLRTARARPHRRWPLPRRRHRHRSARPRGDHRRRDGSADATTPAVCRDAVASSLARRDDADIDGAGQRPHRRFATDESVQLLWICGVGGLSAVDTQRFDTDEFPDEITPLAAPSTAKSSAQRRPRAVASRARDRCTNSVSERIRTEPPRPLVADENGETVISLLDDAIAFVHEPTIGDIIYG